MGDDHLIESLATWDTGAEIGEAAYVRLRAHPRYAEAVRAYAAHTLAMAASDRALDGLMKDAGRTVAGLCALHLHVSGGLTLPRLKALCADFGLVSPGRARALLLYMRYLGYVEPAAETRRGGPAVYAPTARHWAGWLSLQRGIVATVALLEPAAGRLAEALDRPGVLEAYTRAESQSFLEGARQADLDMAYFRVFMHRNGGIQIVHALLTASAEDVFPPRQPIPFSAPAAARRFGVSRMHVRRLMEAARAHDLLTQDADGAVTFTAAGREALDYVFSTQMIRHLISAGRTLQARPDLATPAQPEGEAA